MAGIIVYLAPVDHASGKILGANQKWTAVHRTWGKKQRGCNVTGVRNYKLNPITENEAAQRQAFTDAAALRKLILNSATFRAQWLKRFQDARKAGTTDCSTLSGFLMQQGMLGNIADDGSYAGA